ncbi:MAG: DUF5989 family protein [Longimicrobiales bacterium]
MQPPREQRPEAGIPQAGRDAERGPEHADHELERAARSRRSGVLLELLHFLGENKKWWLLPIIVVILLFGLLVLLSGTAVAPFIYPLF